MPPRWRSPPASRQTAMEFLERGRGVLLDRLLDDSADLARLDQIDPGRARRFEDLQRDLDSIIMPDPEAYDFDLPPVRQSKTAKPTSAARWHASLTA